MPITNSQRSVYGAHHVLQEHEHDGSQHRTKQVPAAPTSTIMSTWAETVTLSADGLHEAIEVDE